MALRPSVGPAPRKRCTGPCHPASILFKNVDAVPEKGPWSNLAQSLSNLVAMRCATFLHQSDVAQEDGNEDRRMSRFLSLPSRAIAMLYDFLIRSIITSMTQTGRQPHTALLTAAKRGIRQPATPSSSNG